MQMVNAQYSIRRSVAVGMVGTLVSGAVCDTAASQPKVFAANTPPRPQGQQAHIGNTFAGPQAAAQFGLFSDELTPSEPEQDIKAGVMQMQRRSIYYTGRNIAALALLGSVASGVALPWVPEVDGDMARLSIVILFIVCGLIGKSLIKTRSA